MNLFCLLSLECLKQAKLRSQLMIMLAVIKTIIIACLLCVSLINFWKIDFYFSSISNKIFEENTQKIQLKISRSYYNYFIIVFSLNANTLSSFTRLYYKTKKQVLIHNLEIQEEFQMSYGGIEPIPEIIKISKGYGNQDISYSFMCFSNFTQFEYPLSQSEQVGLKIQEQMQAYQQIYYQAQLISQSFLYSYIIKEKTFSTYPCLNRGQGIFDYNPEKRDWFKQVRKMYSQNSTSTEYDSSFTNPYLYKVIGLSLVQPIIDESKQLIGGVGTNFLGTKIVQNLSSIEFGFEAIFLISNDGIMIMHPFTVNIQDLPLYIYNQSITGFNFTDWEYMNNITMFSNCQNLQQYSIKLKCRYNSIYQKEMIISMEQIVGFNMTLIILLSSEDYILFYSQFQNSYKQQTQDLLKLFLLSFSSFIFITFFSLYFFTWLLFYPIQTIIANILNRILFKKNQFTLFLPKSIEFFMSTQMKQLFSSYDAFHYQFNQLSLNKTALCSQIEKLKFPCNNKSLKKFLKFTRTIKQGNLDLDKISNYNKDDEKLREIFSFIKYGIKSNRNF